MPPALRPSAGSRWHPEPGATKRWGVMLGLFGKKETFTVTFVMEAVA
ncbi:MAG TPA: hypothetical protein VGN09_13410 [Vicinamibacteria bacterium]|jgi:hypothetical protein